MFFIFCDRPSITSLAVNRQSRYRLQAPAKSGAGLDLLKTVTGDIRRASVFFYVVRTATPLWRAGRGRRKTRRFPVTPVRSTPSGSATRGIDLSGGGNINPLQEVATMATIPTQTHPLLSVPFNAATDFTVLPATAKTSPRP
ncbi:ash family protein [Salmonella enterica]